MTINGGIVLSASDAKIELQARRAGVDVTIGDGSAAYQGSSESMIMVENGSSPYQRTLYIQAGASVPWHLVDAGFDFLAKWDAAAPLAGALAAEIGTPLDREMTAETVRDLRVPVYACELLFMRRSEAADELLRTWRVAEPHFSDARLAFIYALYRVKPLFLALPRTWLEGNAPAQPARTRRTSGCVNLVRLEIAPGRYVSCRPDEVETYRERFAQMKGGRRA